MQGINTSEREREREKAIANTGELFRGSSIIALHPRLQHYEGFPHPTGLLGAATPTTSSLKLLDSLVPLLFPQEQHTQIH